MPAHAKHTTHTHAHIHAHIHAQWPFCGCCCIMKLLHNQQRMTSCVQQSSADHTEACTLTPSVRGFALVPQFLPIHLVEKRLLKSAMNVRGTGHHIHVITFELNASVFLSSPVLIFMTFQKLSATFFVLFTFRGWVCGLPFFHQAGSVLDVFQCQ